MININLPADDSVINNLHVGDKILISGTIFCGRDAVLPKIVDKIIKGDKEFENVIKGSLIFHTAVSVAGVGPTSSNKVEIESSIVPLSELGVKIHLGKGKIKKETIEGMKNACSIFCVVPPITAILNKKIKSVSLIAYPELGMEAFYKLEVDSFPAIVAAAHGESIYE